MNRTQSTTTRLAPAAFGSRVTALRLLGDVGTMPSAEAFAALARTYRSSGGLALAEAVSAEFEGQGQGDFVTLARLIGAGHLFAVRWHEDLWVPRFQFQRDDFAPKPAVHRVLAELGGAFDDWGIAAWFVLGNDWLAGRRPVDLIDKDLQSVLGAARGDRFIANG